MSRRLAPWCLVLIGLAGGCPVDCEDQQSLYFSEGGRWRFSASGLQADPCDLPGSHGVQQDEPLLVGTRWCPAIGCVEQDKCPSGLTRKVRAACYESSVQGPGHQDEGCLVVTGSGELVWRFDPLPCEHEGLFFPEQIRLRGVAVEEVRGRLVSYLDTLGKDYLFAKIGEEFSEELTPPAEAELLKVAADQPVHLALNLWAGDRRVAWSRELASLEVETLRGPAPTVVFGERTTVLVQAPAGSEAALWLVAGPTRVSLGRVRGVATETLKELEVVVAYASFPEEGSASRVPLAARAVARDEQGDLVYGARAEWEVLAGSFAFTPMTFYTEGANLDYVLLIDGHADGDKESYWCFPMSSTGKHRYTGRIAAHVAGLSAEVDLDWTYVAGSSGITKSSVLTLSGTRPAPNCEGPGFDELATCDCVSAPTDTPGLALLALLGLGVARRRRRA